MMAIFESRKLTLLVLESENLPVNTMTADDPAPCVAGSSAATALNM